MTTAGPPLDNGDITQYVRTEVESVRRELGQVNPAASPSVAQRPGSRVLGHRWGHSLRDGVTHVLNARERGRDSQGHLGAGRPKVPPGGGGGGFGRLWL